MQTLIKNSNNTIAKSDLRKYALSVRNQYYLNGSLDYISKVILNKIENLDIYKSSNHIALYFPIKNEINLTRLTENKEKHFYFPRIINNEMEFVEFFDFSNITIGKYGIPEPFGNKVNPKIFDIIITPALIANKKRYRIGYGKGYYDSFYLKHNLKAVKILPIIKKLILDFDFQEEHDMPCDILIDEM